MITNCLTWRVWN